MKRVILNLIILVFCIGVQAQRHEPGFEALVRAAYFIELQQYDSAVKVLDSLEKTGTLAKNNLAVPNTKLRVYQAQGDCKSSIEMLHLINNRINASDNKVSTAFSELVIEKMRDNYRCIGNKDSAVQFALLTIKTKPNDPAHKVALAKIFMDHEEYELALQILNQIDVLGDYAPLDAVIVKAQALIANDSARAAADLLGSQMEWEQYQKDRMAIITMGEAHFSLLEYAKACEYFTLASRMVVLNAQTHPNNGPFQATLLLKELMKLEQNRALSCAEKMKD